MARDHYPAYFAEKLWQWLPAIYRELDGQEGGGALRAFLEALADQAALLKRSQDRLWDDAFVELASDWAVPYIGELMGTRLVSALNPRARRADVAKTIYYRRRKGTLAILEQLIADIAAWDGTVVEEMHRLARLRHGLDGTAGTGRLTRTPAGGLADLREARGALLAGTPFDEFHYTPDIRRPQGRSGQRGIPRLSFHLYRLRAVSLLGVQPRRIKTLPGPHQGFTFDPSGRDVPLFCRNDSQRDWGSWGSANEWDLPQTITCRLLNEAFYAITDGVLAWILDKSTTGAPIASQTLRTQASADLRLLFGQRFASAAALARVLAALPSGVVLTDAGVLNGLLERSLVADCGRAALLPDEDGTTSDGNLSLGLAFIGDNEPPFLPRSRSCGANLIDWTLTPPLGIDWVVDPERGRFLVHPRGHALTSIRVLYHQGWLAPIGAGAYGRAALALATPRLWEHGNMAAGCPAEGGVQIADSATYVNPPDQTAVRALAVSAAEGQRPYLRLTNFWRFGAGAANATLVLDGLWIGTGRRARSVVLQAESADCSFERVTLRACTLDPGGLDANGAPLAPVTLVVTCFVEELVIDNSILAAIRLEGAQAAVGRLILRDSMVHSRPAEKNAVPESPVPSRPLQGNRIPLDLPTTQLHIERSTVVAHTLDSLAIRAERIEASNCLLVGQVQVTDTQGGCVRFSALGPGSAVPHPYKSQTLDDLPRLFASTRFGDPHYLQLSPVAPAAVAQGGEHGGEIGAFAGQLLRIKQQSLLTKINEYMPFGRLPNLIFEN